MAGEGWREKGGRRRVAGELRRVAGEEWREMGGGRRAMEKIEKMIPIWFSFNFNASRDQNQNTTFI